LKLLNAQQKLRNLLQITRLYTIFECFDDETSALRSYTKPDAASPHRTGMKIDGYVTMPPGAKKAPMVMLLMAARAGPCLEFAGAEELLLHLLAPFDLVLQPLVRRLPAQPHERVVTHSGRDLVRPGEGDEVADGPGDDISVVIQVAFTALGRAGDAAYVPGSAGPAVRCVSPLFGLSRC
jgi:hypothetical protein